MHVHFFGKNKIIEAEAVEADYSYISLLNNKLIYHCFQGQMID